MVSTSRACTLDSIQLFQQKLSHKSVEAFATMLKGIMGNMGNTLKLKAFNYDKRIQHKRVYALVLPETLITSIKEHQTITTHNNYTNWHCQVHCYPYVG